jgi:hypothetical protein
MDKTKGTAEQKTERQLKCLSKELGLSSAEQPVGVLFRPWVVRAFFQIRTTVKCSWSGQTR